MTRLRNPAPALIALCLMQCLTSAGTEESAGHLGFSATFRNGSLVSLIDDDGHTLVVDSGETSGAGISWESGHEKASGSESVSLKNTPNLDLALDYDLGNATLIEQITTEPGSGDLILTQTAESTKSGLKQVQWSIGMIPLDSNIIVPGAGGVRLTKDSPGDFHSYSYPMGWEAQLVIIEGQTGGFYVWADDTEGNFKGLVVRRSPEGWLLTFSSTNQAPFAGLTRCQSKPWHLNVYQGDWRVPARRYRDWMQAQENFIPLAEQTPAWVAGVRTMVYSGSNIELLDSLAQVFNPPQTVLYLNHWRKQEFDRMYPDYDQYASGVRQYIERAHELGFRIMVHMNFFAVDPTHPVYESLSKHHIRSPSAPFKTLGYKNTRQNPPVELAYINPASPGWQELFIERTQALVEDLKIDAIHLDQNFHVHNDQNGLIDDMTMSQGIIAFHQAVREALPEVALSGEGLNEVSSRDMAFAQRHVYSAMRGTIDRAALSMAHPISSYLFSPYCYLYGWLGQPSPDDNWTLYNVWWENYRPWGILPTVKTIRSNHEDLLDPSPGMRQALDKAQYWQKHLVVPDTDGDWSADIAFPYQTDDGLAVIETKNGAVLANDEEIARTVSGVTEVELPGTIPGWKLYNAEKIFGLNPSAWYPYFETPRDLSVPHISELQDGFSAKDVVVDEAQLSLETFQTGGLVFDCVEHLQKATVGLLMNGRKTALPPGDSNLSHNAILNGTAGTMRSTPPSATGMSEDFESDAANRARGLGEVYASFTVTLPDSGNLRFYADVYMDGRSIGKDKTDGVTFKVVASNKTEYVGAELHNDTATPQALELDLARFAGQTITLELSAGAGPANDATEDRGIWDNPRIEHNLQTPKGLLAVSQAPDWLAGVALENGYAAEPSGETLILHIPMPGEILLKKPAPPIDS